MTLFLVLRLLVASPAIPRGDVREAERLVHESMRDYDLGYFERSLAEAEQAYRLDPLPQLLFNIGQLHRALKHWDKAVYFWGRYLAKMPGARNRAQVELLVREAEAASAREAAGAGRAKAAPPVRTAGHPVALPVVVVSAPAKAKAKKRAGATSREEDEGGWTAAGATPPVPAAALGRAPAPRRRSHLLGISLLAAGVAAAALAAGGQIPIQGYLADRAIAAGGPNTGTYSHLFGERQAAGSWLTVSIVAAIAGAAGIAAGIVTW